MPGLDTKKAHSGLHMKQTDVKISNSLVLVYICTANPRTIFDIIIRHDV